MQVFSMRAFEQLLVCYSLTGLFACDSFRFADNREIKMNPSEPNSKEKSGKKVGGSADLGVVALPSQTKNPSVAYTWKEVSLDPSFYTFVYRLANHEAEAISLTYQQYAQGVGFRRTGDKSFAWVPPSGCPKDLQCVYDRLISQGQPTIAPIAKVFRGFAEQKKMNANQLAALLLSFVQNIPYELPKEPFGLRPPALVVSKKAGDCDSKALLLHMLLDAVGIDSVVISSNAHAHAMAAIAVPVGGNSFTWQGRRYSFAETTATNSPIGFVDPKLLHPNDWRVTFIPKRKKNG